jgi:RimJ/RimL family protein N-acetyltransferase
MVQEVGMNKKNRLPNNIQCEGFTIKKLIPKKDKKLFEELLLLYTKNKRHLHYWHREIPELFFKTTRAYIKYLNNQQLFCYVLILSEKVIGCIEIGKLTTDEDSYRCRSLSYWIDKKNKRKGIMFNALSSLEDAFRSLELDYFTADVSSENDPSYKLLEKLNYKKYKFSFRISMGGKDRDSFVSYKKNLLENKTLEEKKQKYLYNKCLRRIQLCKKLKYKKLNLSSLDISELPEEASKLYWIRELDLSYNKLERLPDWIANLKNLEYLDISSNDITENPEIIKKLPKLKEYYGV